MRFFDRLFNRSGQNADRATEVTKRVTKTKSLVEQVWDAPALFNRKTRRAVGMLSKVWRWNLNATYDTRRVFIPRYIRRHFKGDQRDEVEGYAPQVIAYGAFTHPKTRRERKARARIIRLASRTGIRI